LQPFLGVVLMLLGVVLMLLGVVLMLLGVVLMLLGVVLMLLGVVLMLLPHLDIFVWAWVSWTQRLLGKSSKIILGL
jgi:membrane-bound ClpP family serine protease